VPFVPQPQDEPERGGKLQPQRGCAAKPRVGAAPTLGNRAAMPVNPNGVAALWPENQSPAFAGGHNPVGVDGPSIAATQGCPFGPALIVDPKLFTGGEESPRKLSPQPTVNNFAARVMAIVNKVNFGARAPRSRRAGKTNGPTPYLARSKPRLSLPARRLGPKRILKMTTLDVSAIRTSPGPSQRALSTSTSQLL